MPKISESLKKYHSKHDSWNKGKKLLNRSGENHHFYGKHRTDQEKINIGNAVREAYKKIKKTHFKYGSNGKVYPANWHEVRKEIYKRDKWVCQECGVKCFSKSNPHKDRIIQCHHIDYNVDNTDSSNLITLCANCHCKTNFRNKDYWIDHFNSKEAICQI
jgi:hypothetical protein